MQLCGYFNGPRKDPICPAVVLSFDGLELDALAMEARLPVDKLNKCKDLLSDFIKRKKVTLKELQSLNSTLNFACCVVVPGRAFLRRLIDLTKGIKCAHNFLHLNKSIKADLKMWQTFLRDFNGHSFFLADGWSKTSQL